MYSRFSVHGGIWDRVLAALQAAADARGALDWSLHFLDGPVIRAHPHAAGAKRGRDQALGKSKGGFSTKLHLRCEGFGKPITWVLTGGQRLEATHVQAPIEGCAVRRPSGQIRVRPARVAGDKGYTGRKIRRYLRRRENGTVISRLRNEPRQGVLFDRAAYRTRNRIERLINCLKQFRAVATRYDKLAVRLHATVTLAAIRLWL